MKRLTPFILFILTISVTTGFAQDETIKDAKIAIKAGSAKSVVLHCNDIIELKTDTYDNRCSKAHAEFVLKAFFKTYPITSIDFLHIGTSPGGAKYAVGQYNYDGGSFRIHLVVRKSGNKYLIDTLKFYKE